MARIFNKTLALAFLVGSLTACSGSENGPEGTESSGPLYATATSISTDSGSTTYVRVFSKFEEELDLKTAREFSGWADLGTSGKYLFVSSGEGPTVERFTINGAGELEEAGKINFGNHVQDASFYNQTIVSETKAYLVGDGEYIVWNPTSLEIVGTIPFPEDIVERDGIPAYVGMDRSAVLRDGLLYHAASWSDTESLTFLPDSRIIVLDTETDEIVSVLTANCPDLAIADRDELGNLYFSNWVWAPGGLITEGPSTCAVRIPAGQEGLDDWSLQYAEASGHEGAALGYLGNGSWIFSSFKNELASYVEGDDPFDWLFGNVWELTTIDPQTLETAPVSGLPQNGGGYYMSRLDGLSHLLMPGDGYATTTISSVDDSGVATNVMHTEGWATRLFRVR